MPRRSAEAVQARDNLRGVMVSAYDLLAVANPHPALGQTDFVSSRRPFARVQPRIEPHIADFVAQKCRHMRIRSHIHSTPVKRWVNRISIGSLPAARFNAVEAHKTALGRQFTEWGLIPHSIAISTQRSVEIKPLKSQFPL